MMEGATSALVISLRGWKNANEEPETEATVRGPREGFCETLLFASTSLLRRKIKKSQPEILKR